MRFDRLAGIAFIVIGALALFGRSTGAGFVERGADRLLDTREEQVPASSLEALHLDVGAGSLVVLGDRNAANVSLRAEFFGPQESTLEELELAHSVAGNLLLVETHTGRSSGRIDLELRVPMGLNLRVDDGSGAIRIDAIDGDVSIQDGSGSIRVQDVGGDLRVQDGSGSLVVRGVAGSTEISDGSGSITLSQAAGSVQIKDDSGSISVQGVGGDATIHDGSGSITVRDVEGRFHLASDGSGSVSTSGIRGGVDS